MNQALILEETNIREKKDGRSKVIGKVKVDEIVELYGVNGGFGNIKTSSGIEGYIQQGTFRKSPVPPPVGQEEAIDPKIKNKKIMEQDKRTKELAERAKQKRRELESEKYKRTTYYVDKEILFKLAQLYDFQPDYVTKKEFINDIFKEVIDSYVAKEFEFEEFDPDNKKHLKRI